MTIAFHKPPFVLKSFKIEVTHNCPLSCTHCSSDAGPDIVREMSREKALDICDQAIAMGLSEIDISGGEPVIWSGINEVVDRCASGHLDVTLYTSGFVEDFEARIRVLKKYGLKRAIFSIFGADATTHERVTRRAGSYLKTLHSIESARDTDLRPELHFVPFKHNYDQLPRLVDLSIDIGVKRVSILRFVPHGRGQLTSDMVLDRVANLALRRMIEEGRRRRIDIRTGSPYNFLLLSDNPKCCAGIDRLIVGPDYRIFPCDAFKGISSEQLTGTDEFSSLDRWSLRDCWEHSPYLRVVRTYLTTDFPKECKTCGILDACLSGCLAQKVLVNRDLRKDIDPMCLRSKE